MPPTDGLVVEAGNVISPEKPLGPVAVAEKAGPDSGWETLQALVRSLGGWGDRPALVALGKNEVHTWSYALLADQAARLATGLAAAGLGRGARAALFAPNSPEWVLAFLALIDAGAVPVLLDVQTPHEDLVKALRASAPRRVFTTRLLAAHLERALRKDGRNVVLLDEEEGDRGWRRYLAEKAGPLPPAAPEDAAAVFYTSGATGEPKGVPLTHRNLVSNLLGVLGQKFVREDDRLLMPLPLHHTYPVMVGLLMPLACGIPIILPGSLTGTEILRGLRQGRATAMLGVPRLLAAVVSALEGRVGKRGRLTRGLFSAAVHGSTLLRRRLGVHAGRWLFASLHRQFGPALRTVVSGGSALDPELARKMEALGWRVATGYGLTETSPVVTFNSPGQGHLDTAGRILPGVEVRFGVPERRSENGEVLVKGPNVFSGYLDMPEETRQAFTEDGYFRTGDVGWLDGEGYLHLIGRKSSMIVLASGENVRPEEAEGVLEQAPHVHEAGVLESEGRLAALVVPDPDLARRVRDGDGAAAAELRRTIEAELAAQSGRLPSHHQVQQYAITFDPLPRTHLGKLRRPMLRQRYEEARRQDLERAYRPRPLKLDEMEPEDRELLEIPVAEELWDWLVRRYAHLHLTPDSSMHLDLGVDSLGWLDLTLQIRHRTGANLDEGVIGRIVTVRDLLRESVEAVQASRSGGHRSVERLRHPEALLDDRQKRWLRRPGPAIRGFGSTLLALDRRVMRWAFGLRVYGIENLPARGAYVISPNHQSLLDSLVVAASLPKRVLKRTYWGAWVGIMFNGLFMRLVSRSTRVMPVDPDRRPLSSLAFGAAALEQGHPLVWFPEGGLTRDGTLKRFEPGVGLLLLAQPAPVVPVWIAGTYQVLPKGSRWPRRGPVSVTFGKPIDPDELLRRGSGQRPHERITRALHDVVAELGQSVAACLPKEESPPETGL